MDNMVKKKLSAFRKRQTVFVIIYGLINAAVIAGIIVYYRLKEQALAGALYLHDNASVSYTHLTLPTTPYV